MEQQHVIEVGGQFAGLAIGHGQDRFRFRAIDLRVEELDESLWPTLADVRRVVSHLFTTGRLPGHGPSEALA